MGIIPGIWDQYIPGVWKLMRLISTGSLGWWGARSALFSRHLVRGSESLRLLQGEQGGQPSTDQCESMVHMCTQLGSVGGKGPHTLNPAPRYSPSAESQFQALILAKP
jgi:hypothetical protein